MKQIGKNIKKHRIEKGMTQDQLAEKLNVTWQAVSNWEIGKTQPSIETLTALGSLFGISVEALIYGRARRMDISPDNATGFGVIFGALFLLIMTILRCIVRQHLVAHNHSIPDPGRFGHCTVPAGREAGCPGNSDRTA